MSDWLSDIGEEYSPEQELALIDQCMSDDVRMPIRWVGVCNEYKDHQIIFCVSSDALSLGHPTGQVRVNVSFKGAQTLCDALGLQMPTALMVDRVWEQAPFRITPKTFTPDIHGRIHVRNRHDEGVTVNMMGLTAMVAHSDRVQASIERADSLVCNVGKWWVLNSKLRTLPDRAVNYGWFASGAPSLSVTGKQLWQSAGTRHNVSYRDYSQTFVPIGQRVIVDGEIKHIAEVLAHPTLSYLLSHEGPVADRHPHLSLWAGAKQRDLSPDPRKVVLVGEYTAERPTTPAMAIKPYFIQSKNYRPANRRFIDLIVIHTMEAPEKPKTARAVANWFASKNAPQASCHYAIDDQEVVQCVRDEDVAWGAPGTNHNGLHLEHAGYASQTICQWQDVYSSAVLNKSERLAARLCIRYDIPRTFVSAEGLVRGHRGITTHAEVTKACILAKKNNQVASPFYRSKTTHTDPGRDFPIASYIQQVQRYMVGS